MDVSALLNFVPAGPGNLKGKIYTQVGQDLARVEEEINRLLDTDIPLISVVGRYIMGSGGKRLRPLLTILSSRLCGYDGNDDVALAVVFEFVHAATLLHDDVVDHAEFRRSRPSAKPSGAILPLFWSEIFSIRDPFRLRLDTGILES